MNYYSDEQTYALLNDIGVNIVSDTADVWMCLCPFHGNSNTPAFAVNKSNGTFICFNGACGAYGDMLSLITQVSGKGTFAAHRMIARAKAASPTDFSAILEKAITDEPMPTFSQNILDGMKAAYWKSDKAQQYMINRGFTEFSMDHYSIGYSPKQDSIAVPMHDHMGTPVGVVGRSISGKSFHNSKKLPRNRTLWNIHRAKRHAKTVITEATFDSMRVWQATGIESVAVLGSYFNAAHAAQLNKYFTHLVIMTDDDQKLHVKGKCRSCREIGLDSCKGHNTGLELGRKIAAECRGLSITWAHMDSLKRFDGMKDAGDMTDEQIRYAIDNGISNVEMHRLAPA